MNTHNKIISPIRTPEGEFKYIEYDGVTQRMVDSGGPPVPKLDRTIFTLPSGVGDVVDAVNLYRRAKGLLREVVEFKDERDLSYTAIYGVTSWVFENYLDIGYIGFLGNPGSGKTTAMQALLEISYNSLNFSSAASQPAIFRSIDLVQGMLGLEEVQQNSSDSSSDSHKLLVNGTNRSGNVPRVVQKGNKLDFEVAAFKVFSPKALSGRSIPNDDAITTRTHCIKMQPLSLKCFKEKGLVKITDEEWCRKAEKFRNDALLYRQRRQLGLNKPANIYHSLGDRINQLTLREFQVNEWLLAEFPCHDDLNIFFEAILENKRINQRRKEEGFEPSVLYTIFDLLDMGLDQRVYLTSVVEALNDRYGIKSTSREVSTICEQNGIERRRNKSGRYIISNSDFVAKKIIELGFSDPRKSTLSASSSSNGGL